MPSGARTVFSGSHGDGRIGRAAGRPLRGLIPCDELGDKANRHEEIWLDFKALTGSVTVLLTPPRHLSAVMIALWDVEPLPSKAGTRLANVELVERPKRQRGYPRVRMLVQNPRVSILLVERPNEVF